MLNTAQYTGDCRVIFVASRSHSQGVFDPSNINGETSYSRYTFYNNSKLYNVSFYMCTHVLLYDYMCTNGIPDTPKQESVEAIDQSDIALMGVHYSEVPTT